MSMQDVDWDRLDKRKFFVVGLGLFSSVTTCLYPLTVVKTRQMASSHTSPGIAGAWQTARTVAATDGIPGFYRGFTTAVLATIPVRMVYMSALEMTKTATAKLGAKLELAPTTQATVANFCGGGAASLASQCLIVPVDVITQRMMVEGMDAGASSRATTIHSRQGSSSRASSSSSSSNGSSRSSNTTVTAQMERNMQQPSTASQASTSRHANGAPSGVGRATAGIEAASATAQQQRSFSSLASSSSSSSSPWRNSSTTPTLPAGKASQAQPSAGVVHSSATAGIPLEQRLYSNRTTSSSSSSSGAGAGTAHMQRMSAIQMARLIVKEEGLMGLYRGFVPSISTYVPSSAVWWGLYALYQKSIMAQLHPSPTGTCAPSSTSETVAVQTSAAVLSGLTTGFLITPLDLIKTRMQVASLDAAGRQPTWGGTLRTVLSEPAGVRGLFRGAAPRMVSSCVWGTAMLSVYETLVRISVKAGNKQ